MLPACLLSGRKTFPPLCNGNAACKLLWQRPEREGKWMHICLRTLSLPTADHFNHKQPRRKSLLRSATECACVPHRTTPLLPLPITDPRHPQSFFCCFTHHPSELLCNYFVISNLNQRGFFQPIKSYTSNKHIRPHDTQNIICACYTDKQETSKYNPEAWTILLDLSITWKAFACIQKGVQVRLPTAPSLQELR